MIFYEKNGDKGRNDFGRQSFQQITFFPLSGRAQISESNAEKPRDGLSGSTIYDVYLSQSGEQSEKGLYRDGN